MSSNNDTTVVEEKKEQQINSTNNDMGNKVQNFISSTLIQIVLYVIIYFALGSVVLYICKLSQSNILPTDINCYPFTSVKPEIEEIGINIFATQSNPPKSKKIKFPYDEYNSSNYILDYLRAKKEDPNTGIFFNYFISIIEDIFATNYGAINTIGNSLNGSFHELFIIIFGPIIFTILLSLLSFFNNFYLVYLWFSKMTWFFLENKYASKDNLPQWVEGNFLFGYGTMFIFSMMMLFGFPIFLLLFVLCSAFVVLWCLFTCLGYSCIIDNIKVNSADIISKVFLYHKTFILVILSYFVIKNVFTYFGNIAGASCIAAFIVFIAFFAQTYFKPETPNNLSAVTSYKQAKKVCNNISFNLTNILSASNIYNTAKKLSDLNKHGPKALIDIGTKKINENKFIPDIHEIIKSNIPNKNSILNNENNIKNK